MAAPCFKKPNSHPPVCGIHNVALLERGFAIDSNAPYLGRVTVYVCPVSRKVVAD
jgi:hypothetical protein